MLGDARTRSLDYGSFMVVPVFSLRKNACAGILCIRMNGHPNMTEARIPGAPKP